MRGQVLSGCAVRAEAQKDEQAAMSNALKELRKRVDHYFKTGEISGIAAEKLEELIDSAEKAATR